jgi:hypothetical protein
MFVVMALVTTAGTVPLLNRPKVVPVPSREQASAVEA